MAERIIAPLRDEAEFTEIFDELLTRSGVSLKSERTRPLIYALYKRLIEVSRVMNLTAITECSAVAEKHMLDCILPALMLCERGYVKEGISLTDIGAGAGFPTLPISVLSNCGEIPKTVQYAVDSTAKKIGYINETAKILKLSFVQGIAGRAEELAAGRQGKKKPGVMREKSDIVTARAVSALPVLVELCAPFVKVGGIFAAMKADNADEIASSANGAKLLGIELSECVNYTLPSGDARSLVIYKKVVKTPDEYPRQYAKITSKPL